VSTGNQQIQEEADSRQKVGQKLWHLNWGEQERERQTDRQTEIKYTLCIYYVHYVYNNIDI